MYVFPIKKNRKKCTEKNVQLILHYRMMEQSNHYILESDKKNIGIQTINPKNDYNTHTPNNNSLSTNII